MTKQLPRSCSKRGKRRIIRREVQEQVTKVGHIILKSTEHLLKAKANSSKLCLDDLVRMNTDALALLGHVCFEITQRRRESIKPSLHKDYAMLCSSNVPVTNLLFGDDLQTELTHILYTWKTITSNSEILTSVSGEMIPFIRTPVQNTIPFQPEWKGTKNSIIDNEILSLLNNGVNHAL